MPSIYLSNITVIDCAVVYANGSVHGHSFNPRIRISSDELLGDEQVVADFSNIKSRIKKLLDDPILGLDHKLLVSHSFAKTTATQDATQDNPAHWSVGTTKLAYVSPRQPGRHGARLLQRDVNGEFDACSVIAAEIVDLLLAHLTDFTFVVTVDEHPNVDPAWDKNLFTTFRYTHGLPKSTSFGCQNILHGHASYVQFFTHHYPELVGGFTPNSVEPQQLRKQQEVVEAARTLLDGTHFTSQEHYNPSTSSITYICPRGVFHLTLLQDVVALPYEPTVENMAEWLKENLMERMLEAGVTGFYLSEGLWKGAYVELPTRNHLNVASSSTSNVNG